MLLVVSERERETGESRPPSSYPQKYFMQVSSVVDASVHGHEPFKGELVFDIGIVKTGVQHDDREREDIAGVCQTTKEGNKQVDMGA